MLLSDGLKYHLKNKLPISENIYRPGSDNFFELFKEIRSLYRHGLYTLDESEIHFIKELDIGEFGIYEGEVVPLDFPLLVVDELDEAKYKGKNVELNKPKRGSEKAYVYVKTKKKDKKGRYKIKKVPFGSSMPDAMGDSKAHKKRRKSFGDRHNCADKDDKTKPGYWSCRATKFFGRDIPGWW
jgi:hypothetical protein